MVASLRKREAAISAFERPRAISRSTLSSRSVSSDSCAGGPLPAGARWTKRSIIRRVIAGARSASPSATVRTASTSFAGGTFLRMKPPAPAFMAW